MSELTKAYLQSCKQVCRLELHKQSIVVQYAGVRSSSEIKELEEALDVVVASLRVHEKERDDYILQITGRG